MKAKEYLSQAYRLDKRIKEALIKANKSQANKRR